jgi:GDP-4-dehydro-6-deoxy-D-mannose reductase
VPRRVLITGITGFAGSHLAEHAVACGDEVHGFALEKPPYRNLASVAGEVRMHRGDLTDADAVRAAVEAARPDVVVHLAGQAVPALASQDPTAAVRVNVLGTAAVVEALRASDAALVFASTAEVYGAPQDPAREDAPIRPPNVYAATMVASEALARELGGRSVILRPVGQIGPRQHPALAASAFARQIALIEAGREAPVIQVGNLDARRDLTDVRDTVRAYIHLVEKGRPGIAYNVCSGRAHRIGDLLERLIQKSRVPVEVRVDPSRYRPNDVPLVLGNPERIERDVGWRPTISIDQTLTDLLEYWRKTVAMTTS